MKNSTKNLIYVLLTGLVLAACAPLPVDVPATLESLTATPTSDEAFVLAGTSWRLTSYGAAEGPTQVIEGMEPTLEFQDEAQVGGSTGCNTFGGDYRITMEYEIFFTEIFATEMACLEEGVMDQEREYLDALNTASLFEYTGDTLRIWYDDSQSTLTFTRINAGETTPSP